ncbi:MAG: kelch repeat-containing protein, partial [Candidatus Kapaibacterium sp.]
LQIGMNTLEVFDPSTNTWSTPTTTGTLIGRDAFGTAVVNGLIYVIGGYNGATDINILQVFDPATNTWSTPQTTGKFTTRDGLTACTVGNKIYAMAGVENDFSNTLEVFDPATNTWSTPVTTGWLTPRSNGASDVIDGKIYVVGGTNDTDHFVGGLQVFDPVTNAWSTAVTTDTVIPRRDLGAVTLNGKLYVMGGLKNAGTFSTFSNDIQYFTPAGSSVTGILPSPGVTLFPDPASGMVTVGGMPSGDYQVSVSNALGGNVLPVHHVSGSDATLDLSPLPQGTYFVTLRSSRSVVTERIVKR